MRIKSKLNKHYLCQFSTSLFALFTLFALFDLRGAIEGRGAASAMERRLVVDCISAKSASSQPS